MWSLQFAVSSPSAILACASGASEDYCHWADNSAKTLRKSGAEAAYFAVAGTAMFSISCILWAARRRVKVLPGGQPLSRGSLAPATHLTPAICASICLAFSSAAISNFTSVAWATRLSTGNSPYPDHASFNFTAATGVVAADGWGSMQQTWGISLGSAILSSISTNLA